MGCYTSVLCVVNQQEERENIWLKRRPHKINCLGINNIFFEFIEGRGFFCEKYTAISDSVKISISIMIPSKPGFLTFFIHKISEIV